MTNTATNAVLDDAETEDERASLLRTGYDFDDQLLEGILHSVEKNIRNMCYAMQMVGDYGFEPDEFDKLSSMFRTFYEYVDSQMDTLTRLRKPLERDFTWISLNKLRESEDFRRKPLPREAFVSEEAYQRALARFAKDSAFNEAFGEAVAPANREGK
jgi:hypothetical protein